MKNLTVPGTSKYPPAKVLLSWRLIVGELLYTKIDMMSDLIALQEGILQASVTLPSIKERPKSIDEALSTMTFEESRVCRRKFRKILRKLMKKNGNKIKKKTKKQLRELVMFEIRSRAWDFVLMNEDIEDNDEI